jgi:hypothetical protein
MLQYRGYEGLATQLCRRPHGRANLLAWQAADGLARVPISKRGRIYD